jgi:hypothetical protein
LPKKVSRKKKFYRDPFKEGLANLNSVCRSPRKFDDRGARGNGDTTSNVVVCVSAYVLPFPLGVATFRWVFLIGRSKILKALIVRLKCRSKIGSFVSIANDTSAVAGS